MERKRRIVAAVLGLALVATSAGCLDQTRAANEAIARANAKADEYRAIDQAVTQLLDEAAAVDFTPETVHPAIAKLGEARAKIAERQKVVSEMRAAFASVASLRVNEAVKEYARQQIEIADLLAQVDLAALDLIDATTSFLEMIAEGSVDSAQGETFAQQMQQASERIQALSEQVKEKKAASDAYFDQHLAGGR